jgi:CubicO group peptidase (beta-lactamase class C family)
MPRAVLVSLVAVVALTAAGVASALRADASGDTTTPGAKWQKVRPAEVGLDAAELKQIAAQAKRGKSTCLVVVRDGRLAGEWYFRGTGRNTAQNVFSVTKSFASTLVGIAQADGDLRIGSSASTWIPQWRGTAAQAVTVRDLLSNDSGREWSTYTDYVQLTSAPDRTAYAIGLRQTSAPGRVWAYNNAAIQTLEQVLQEATKEQVAAFARERLFRPLGMTETAMTTDRAGNTQLYQGLRSTCRDLARLGVLMLDHGRWGGKQIVPAAWVREATGRPSTELNAAYGYLWWLNRRGVVGTPLATTSLEAARSPLTKRGRLVPGAPADMYWALGLGNQIVQVDPGTRTVVVRLGTADAFSQPPTFGPAEASKVVTEAVVSR